MKPLRKRTLFAGSVLLGVLLTAAGLAYNHWTRPAPLTIRPLAPGIALSAQIQPLAVATVKAQGYATLIDLRPDGEAADQPPAAAIAAAAHAQNMAFAYIPVPHGEIPASAVTTLANALATQPRPILLYCRSGRRAARTWSLAEAARPGGLPAPAILDAVKASVTCPH